MNYLFSYNYELFNKPLIAKHYKQEHRKAGGNIRPKGCIRKWEQTLGS